MNTLPYDAFKLISDWLTIKELERLFYTGNKRIITLVCKYPINDPVIDPENGRTQNVGRLFTKNAILTHYMCCIKVNDIIPDYVDKISLSNAQLARSVINGRGNITSMSLTTSVMDDTIKEYTQLTKLSVTDPTSHSYLPINSNLREFTLETHQRNINIQEFVESLEYIELIGNKNHYYVTTEYDCKLPYLDNMRVCSGLTTLKLTNLDVSSDLFNRLPASVTSLSLILREFQTCDPIDFTHCKLELKYLEIDCAVINLDKLPASLTSFKVHNNTLSDVTDFSTLHPNLLVLHDLYERTLDTKPRNYNSLPNTLLDLSLSDRHIDKMDFDIIMSRCQKLARFKVKVTIPGYLYINVLFEKLQRRKFIAHHVKFITDYKP